MKAFLLAAGYGTRLRPLTDRIPKCLVPIGDRPLLEWWLELLKKHGVTEVLVNTHYLYDQVRDYIAAYNARNTGLQVVEAYEPELLGSGGTVRNNFSFVKDEENFLICYADNLTNVDLTSMINYHRSTGGLLTMALFRASHPEQCGIANLGHDGKIMEFEEKPEHPKDNLANAGIYVASTKILERFPQKDFVDFGRDVLPALTGEMYGWEIRDYLIDVGTPENYEKAQRDWRTL